MASQSLGLPVPRWLNFTACCSVIHRRCRPLCRYPYAASLRQNTGLNLHFCGGKLGGLAERARQCMWQCTLSS